MLSWLVVPPSITRVRKLLILIRGGITVANFHPKMIVTCKHIYMFPFFRYEQCPILLADKLAAN